MAHETGARRELGIRRSDLYALHQLALSAAGCRTLPELATTATEAGEAIAAVTNVGIALVVERDRTIRVYQGPTATLGVAEIRIMEIAESTPLTDVVRTGAAIVIRTESDFAQRYPSIARRIEPGQVTAMATYPLLHDGEVTGSCFFRYSQAVELTEEREWLIERMVELIALSVVSIADRDEVVDYSHRLEQSNQDLENFAAVVAHDLAGPVRRISSFLQLLLRGVGPLDETTQRYARTVTEQMAHLDALLRDTLAYSQVVTPSDRRERVDLRSVVEGVVGSLSTELSDVRAVVQIGELPTVDADRSLVRQVIQNLVENAIKYRSQERALRVDVSSRSSDVGDEPWWRIVVGDNGIGIDPERSDEVFSMFGRLEPSSDQPGTGVGLAFVKRVIERHGGDIGLESEPGRGSTFWFTLPGIDAPDVL